MSRSTFTILLASWLTVGCTRTESPVMNESVLVEEGDHSHYHVHGADVSHEHTHRNEKHLGHEHEHSHVRNEESQQQED